MNKYVVVVFDNEQKAYQGLKNLRDLHEEGSITLYCATVAQRTADGRLSVKEQDDTVGPVGLGLGALLGGLVGLFGGPVGAVAGWSAGGLLGSSADVFRMSVGDEFLEDVVKELSPEKFALIAEVTEDWTTPLDSSMRSLGGTVIREYRDDVTSDFIERKAEAYRAEVQKRKTEFASQKAEDMMVDFSSDVDRTHEKLQKMADKAKDRLDHTREEMEAKLRALEEQASKASPDVKTTIDRRIADIRKDFGGREQKLRRAYELTQEALSI